MFTGQESRKWFEEWREPDMHYRAADKGLEIFFVSYKAPPQYLREAYVAGKFACIWQGCFGPCEVRLVPAKDEFPDAQLRVDRVYHHLEITMALKSGREMFKEWREEQDKAKRGEFTLAESSEQRIASAREAIPRAVRQKADKQYAANIPITLLVDTDDGRALSAQEMTRLTEPWKDHFAAIYLLCGMDAVMAWPKRYVLRGSNPR